MSDANAPTMDPAVAEYRARFLRGGIVEAIAAAQARLDEIEAAKKRKAKRKAQRAARKRNRR